MTWLVHLWWRLVFWWKKRTGWIDLHEHITITGTVVELVRPDLDGDRCFNVRLDADCTWTITGFGGALTSENWRNGPALHCEIPPWADPALKLAYDQLRVGDRVRVTGAWGFDGVHVGKPEWLEVILALIRHQPNVRDGWFEIHPVHYLEKL